MTNYNIIPFTMVNAHNYGNIFEQMLQLRHKGFILEEKYNVRDYNGLEFDQYDDPHAHYIVIQNSYNNKLVACSRVRRTDITYQVPNVSMEGTHASVDISYMAKDMWKNQISTECLYSHQKHYELTRVYADSALPKYECRKLIATIISASYVYLLSRNISSFAFVTHKALFNMVKKLGMKIDTSCSILIEGFDDLLYASVEILHTSVWKIVDNLLAKTGINIESFVLDCTTQKEGYQRKIA